MATSFGARKFAWHCVLAVVAAAVVVCSFADQADAARRRHKRIYGGFKPAYSAIVIDAKTGNVLHAEQPDGQRYPASVTKVMTLYLLFEQLEAGKMTIHTPLRVSADAASMPPSKLGLRSGSTITVEEAIRALVTKSANDVAATVAENIAGDEDTFAALMTRKARALGMTRTTFRNASGLPNMEQTTTARDLALLGRAIQDRFPRYYRYFSTYSFAYRGRNMANHNKLLGRVEGVDGIKTGYTNASGFNLLTSAKRGERHVVAVVMGGRTGAARDARMRQLIEQHLPRAYAGVRTAPMVAEARPSSVAVKARVPQLGKKPEAIETASAETVPVKATQVQPQAKTVASVGTGTSAPVTAYVAPQKAGKPLPLITQETTAPPVTASMSEPISSRGKGNPNPQPGILGTLPAGERTGTIASKPPVAEVAAAPASVAPPAPAKRSGEWSIQIGAYPSDSAARDALSQAKASGGRSLAPADPYTEAVEKGATKLYRARFAGFDRAGADSACKALKTKDFACMAVRN